jgi:poly(3-hydroxybutyrate) depolymerase
VKWPGRLLLTVLLGWTVAGGAAPGKSRFTFDSAGLPLDVFTYRPADYAGGPLLIVMHGLGRNADGYRDYAVPLADRFGLFIAAPLFDTNRFPTEAYQRGNVLVKGQVQPKSTWTYSRVADLARELRQRDGRAGQPWYLIGHSAGGQFLMRLAAFLPGDATRIVAANPGSLLFPTRDLPFPYGFGGLPEELGGDAAIRRYLAAPLTLLLGTADIEKKDLDLTATAMKQGATRLERGRNCFALAREVARKNGWPFNWRLVEVPGVGHSGEKMFAAPQAAGALFGGSPPGLR